MPRYDKPAFKALEHLAKKIKGARKSLNDAYDAVDEDGLAKAIKLCAQKGFAGTTYDFFSQNSVKLLTETSHSQSKFDLELTSSVNFPPGTATEAGRRCFRRSRASTTGRGGAARDISGPCRQRSTCVNE